MMDPGLKIDIKDRLSWMKKAEGYLERVNEKERRGHAFIDMEKSFE
jgi:hypothetical protein